MRARFLLVVLVVLFSTRATQQDRGAVLFEGAWLFSAAGAPIENSAFVVEEGRFGPIGRRGEVRPPAGATRIDLTGRFVIPALIDAHSHPGYTDIVRMDSSAQNYTRANVIDHLRRYAYYGVASTLSLGLDRGELPFQLRGEAIEGAALFLTVGRGIALPNAGPNAAYWRDAPYGVTGEAEARRAVRELAARKVRIVKIWVDDRGGTVPKLPPALFGPIIREAHSLGLRVVAHVYYLADGKELLRAGIDGFAHGIRDAEVDDEFIALFKTRPRSFLLPNLPDGPPSDDELTWLSETLPTAQIDRMRKAARTRSENAQRLYDVQLRSLRKLHAAGVKIALGTDAGASFDGSSFGWSAHIELADMVQGGLSPADALVAATRNAAEIIELPQSGTIAVGKTADFIVLDANPIADIRNTRRISRVYLRGKEVDRAALRRAWTR